MPLKSPSITCSQHWTTGLAQYLDLPMSRWNSRFGRSRQGISLTSAPCWMCKILDWRSEWGSTSSTRRGTLLATGSLFFTHYFSGRFSENVLVLLSQNMQSNNQATVPYKVKRTWSITAFLHPTCRKQDAGINADFDDEFEMLIDDDDYELDHVKVWVGLWVTAIWSTLSDLIWSTQ